MVPEDGRNLKGEQKVWKNWPDIDSQALHSQETDASLQGLHWFVLAVHASQ